MATIEEGKFKMSDGFEVYTKTWLPVGAPVAALVFIHGFSDHSGRYNTVWPQFAEAGIIVYAFDQRGWGQSVTKKAERGLTGRTDQVINDITTFVKSHLPSSVPLFMMGHSMGGQQTLKFIVDGPEDVKKQVKGFILSSPYVALHPASQPSWIKIRAGRLAMKLLPRFQLTNPLDPKLISHDPEWNEDIKNDELCHDTGTLEGLGDMLERAEHLDIGKTLVKDWDGLHMLFLHGDADGITSYDASQRYFNKIEVRNKDFKSFAGGYHCLYYEPDHKRQYADDIIKFIISRTEAEKNNEQTVVQVDEPTNPTNGQSKL